MSLSIFRSNTQNAPLCCALRDVFWLFTLFSEHTHQAQTSGTSCWQKATLFKGRHEIRQALTLPLKSVTIAEREGSCLVCLSSEIPCRVHGSPLSRDYTASNRALTKHLTPLGLERPHSSSVGSWEVSPPQATATSSSQCSSSTVGRALGILRCVRQTPALTRRRRHSFSILTFRYTIRGQPAERCVPSDLLSITESSKDLK